MLQSFQHKRVQVGVIGAMQRAHPALTQLWLEWTGIPGIDYATFNMTRPERGSNPSSSIHLRARKGVSSTWNRLGDVLGLPEDAPERRRMPIVLKASASAHETFWQTLKKRELEEVDGPLEWWWRLLVMRYKGIHRGSNVLIREAIGDHDILDRGLVSFRNPSLKTEGTRSKHLLSDQGYLQPTHVCVSVRVKRNSTHEGLAFALSDASFKGRFVSKLIDLATARI